MESRASTSPRAGEARPRSTWRRASPCSTALLELRDDFPYAYVGGACSTCRAKVVEGSVEADSNYALHQDDLDRGYVLTCQSHATSPKLVVGLRRLSAAVRRRPGDRLLTNDPSENWSP
jgi:hypothetical protein